MRQYTQRHLVGILALLLAAACGGGRKQVLVAPVVDLAPHSRIGLVTLTSQGASGSLPEFATQRFAERMLGAQQGIEILELGVVPGPLDAAAARRLGAEHGVRTIIVGHLVVSDVKPRATIIGGMNLSAEATLSLAAKMLSTESGATLWTQSSRLRETLASVSMVNGRAVFGAQDPKEAYGEVVDQLVWNVTHDFRATWVRQ
ncbi:MAG TPA: hypothetical protein VM764_02560 [Gemmatimonadaceae bacterium]|nr:hypothetical protein [Gemmatimonadaceae bacterium]